MATERTFSIIKPDATRRNLTGAVNAMIEAAGLRIVAQKRLQLTQAQAEGFYAVHRERGFFGELVAFMISGPVVVQVLEGDNAVLAYRDIMGATNPANAAEGTIRKVHAEIDRGEHRPRQRQRRERGHRDRLLLRPDRDRRLRSAASPVAAGALARQLRASQSATWSQSIVPRSRRMPIQPAGPKYAGRK